MKKIMTIIMAACVLLSVLPAAACAEESWTCPSCGNVNTGNFCSNCGEKKPSSEWVCGNCGQINTTNFCSNCGTRKPDGSSVPVTQGSTISNIRCQSENGITKITWDDSANKGPYSVYFTTDQWENYSTNYGMDAATKKELRCPYLIPGQTYLITVSNGTSEDTVSYQVPKSTFTEFKPSKPITINPNTFDISGDGYYTSFRFDINYPQLSKDRKYALLIAMKTPLGYTSRVRGIEDFELERKWIGYYWEEALSDYLDVIKANFGTIPRGEYTLECYFDQCFYGSTTFKVYPAQ